MLLATARIPWFLAGKPLPQVSSRKGTAPSRVGAAFRLADFTALAGTLGLLRVALLARNSFHRWGSRWYQRRVASAPAGQVLMASA